MAWRRVVLPAPDGPTMMMNSPSLTEREILSRTLRFWYFLVRESMMIMFWIVTQRFLSMKFFVDFAEFFVGEVGVDLGGGDGAVAEHFLDGTDVGAVN